MNFLETPIPQNELNDNEKTYGKWFLGYKQTESSAPNLAYFKYIYPPKNYFYADPFPYSKDGIDYIFFELFDYNRGTLAYFTIINNKVDGPFPVDINYNVHISFPYLFEDNGKLYMIPESCHENQISVFECVNFPNKWRRKKVIIKNVHAADPQIVKIDKLYYLFTLLWKNQSNRQAIYYSDNLLGDWKLHKKVNAEEFRPNDRVTRGAGRIFHSFGLIRPAQFSDRGTNGEAVIMYSIKELTPEKFHEIPLTINYPLNQKMHTYSLLENSLTCIDVREKIPTDKDTEIEEMPYLKKIEEIHKY